jgi:hypothetical protein
MRRLVAHADRSSAVGVGLNGKAQSVLPQQDGGLRRGAFYCGPVPQRIEESATNRLVVGWNPTRPFTHFSTLPAATNYLQGLTSGKPKAEFTRLTVIVRPSPEESKAQSDMPFVQDRDSESRKGAE